MKRPFLRISYLKNFAIDHVIEVHREEWSVIVGIEGSPCLTKQLANRLLTNSI